MAKVFPLSRFRSWLVWNVRCVFWQPLAKPVHNHVVHWKESSLPLPFELDDIFWRRKECRKPFEIDAVNVPRKPVDFWLRTWNPHAFQHWVCQIAALSADQKRGSRWPGQPKVDLWFSDSKNDPNSDSHIRKTSGDRSSSPEDNSWITMEVAVRFHADPIRYLAICYSLERERWIRKRLNSRRRTQFSEEKKSESTPLFNFENVWRRLARSGLGLALGES